MQEDFGFKRGYGIKGADGAMSIIYEGQIYFGTILLEANRWAAEKRPSYSVSEWIPRLREDGFDGIELWEYHATSCTEEELRSIAASKLPISVYSAYISFEDGQEQEEARIRAAKLIRLLGAKGVKYNFGNDPSRLDVYIRNWHRWRGLLPEDCRMLCECHPNTVMEDPRIAAEAFRSMGKQASEAIVHPFHCLGELDDWFTHLGSSITHAHVQLRSEEQKFQRLHTRRQEIKERLSIMERAGFKGSFTLEFVEGTGSGETREALYDAALDDLKELRTLLS